MGNLAINRKYTVLRTGKIVGPYGTMTPTINKFGYESVNLTFEGNVKRKYSVHRLVASVYLGLNLVDSHITVDHIDGNRRNNSVENLRLLSAIENVKEGAKRRRNET